MRPPGAGEIGATDVVDIRRLLGGIIADINEADGTNVADRAVTEGDFFVSVRQRRTARRFVRARCAAELSD